MSDASTGDYPLFTAALDRKNYKEAREIARRVQAALPADAPSTSELGLIATMLNSGTLDRLCHTQVVNEAVSLAEQILIDKKNRPAVERAVRELIDVLSTSGQSLDDELALRVMKVLKNLRVFPAMAELGDRLTALGAREPAIRKMAAQGLIETGHHHAALATLEQLFATTPSDHPEHIDGQGLAGRLHKQTYVDAHKNGAGAAANPALRETLAKSVSRYETGYFEALRRKDTNPGGVIYHGINLLAMVERARRDKITIHSRVDATGLQKTIAEVLGDDGSKAKETWDLATLGEAAVARGDWIAAEHWFQKYAQHKDVTPFELGSTIRQLEQVWQLDTHKDEQSRLLYLLKSQLLAREGGQFTVTTEQRQQLRQHAPQKGIEGSPNFEAIIDGHAPKQLWWLRNGLDRADAVALIRFKSSNRGFGTGFLLRGGDFVPALGNQPVLLTNAHVLSERASEQNALPPKSVPISRARVEFTAAAANGGRQVFDIKEVVWDSPRGELDATLVTLDPIPTRIKPLVASEKKLAVGKSRVIVIGHPQGSEQAQISLFDSPVLQIGAKVGDDGKPLGSATDGSPFQYLHYTNPTEGGNSGSPIFEEDDWEVVGLHHSGPNLESKMLPKLDGEEGQHTANEGILIHSIRETANRQVVGRHSVSMSDAGAKPKNGGSGSYRSGTLQSAAPGSSSPPALRDASPGLLAIDAPQVMCVDIPSKVTVKLSRAASEKLIADARDGGIELHDVMTYAAMTLRLTAPAGGFHIEAVTDALQWLDRRDGRLDDITEWVWSVTPERVGKHQLVVVAQGNEYRDGLQAALPAQQQRFPVTVQVNARARALTFARWAAIAIGGGILSYVGQLVARSF